jgi:hypothetical protein
MPKVTQLIKKIADSNETQELIAVFTRAPTMERYHHSAESSPWCLSLSLFYVYGQPTGMLCQFRISAIRTMCPARHFT